VIDDLDRTIAALLKRELPPLLAEQVQISFASPDGHFPSQSVTPPAINLFLYDIRENLDLRSNDAYVERGLNGMATVRRPPVRVDFSYLITAWASESVPDPAQDEHRLLSEIMRALLRNKSIPGELLQGVMANQELPLPVTALHSSRLQSPGEFWQAIGGRPKTVLNFLVTAAVDVSVPVQVPLVTETVLKIRTSSGLSE
jgi:hypothetical protein